MKPFPVFFILLTLLLSSCAPAAEKQAALGTYAVLQTAAAFTPTSSVTPTYTPPPTPSPTITFTPTLTDTPTPTPSITPTLFSTAGLAPSVTIETWLTLQPPDKWMQKTVNGIPWLEGPDVGGFPPRLTFERFNTAIPMDGILELFILLVQKTTDPGSSSSATQSLTNINGMKYIRMVVKPNTAVENTYKVEYIFQSGKNAILITYSRLNTLDSQWDALVEAAIQTVKILD